MDFTAVILAGGKSSRMGRDKAFLPFQGRPLIQHALDLVHAAGVNELLISGRAGMDFSRFNLPVLLDLTPDQGPLGGIESALRVAANPLVLVLAVDLPCMSLECLRWLCFLSREMTDGSATGLVPVLHNRPEPLAAFYPRQAHGIVRRLLVEQQWAARGFAETCIQQGMAGVATVPPEFETCFANWNSPEDLAAG